MKKDYISLGLMSGTSGDGVDASIIKSDGEISSEGKTFEILENQYFKYNNEILDKIFNLRHNINNLNDLQKFSEDIKSVEREITIFHAEAVNTLEKKSKVDLIGFHGHTIYHNFKEKASIQIGDPNLLSQLTKKNVVYNFRKKDLENGGQGAPLAPIFHIAIANKLKFKFPWIILNIGGISNFTFCDIEKKLFKASDIGPGNCLIDQWIRENSDLKLDTDGLIARSGEIHKQILQDILERDLININQKSFDIKDFDLGFARGLSLEDGAATITEYTVENICWRLINDLNINNYNKLKLILSGGGRKNKFIIEKIKDKLKCDIIKIDDLGIDGDFIESQAFAFLSIRSLNSLPLTFKWMTGCKKDFCLGGEIVKFK